MEIVNETSLQNKHAEWAKPKDNCISVSLYTPEGLKVYYNCGHSVYYKNFVYKK